VNAPERVVWAGCVGDALRAGVVVVVFSAGQERRRAELTRAQSLSAVLADAHTRALPHLAKASREARALGRQALDVIEQRAAGRSLVALVNGLGDRSRSPLSHG